MSCANEKPVDDGLIDRLVDGELGEAERQRLLARLETEPGGWRRCALAFLEAQAWTRSLASAPETGSVDVGRLGRTTHSWSDSGPPANRIPRRESVRRRFQFQREGVLAAGILLSFAAGWAANGVQRPFGPEPTPVATGGGAEAVESSHGSKVVLNRAAEPTEPPDLAQAEPPLEVPSWEDEAPLVLPEPVRRELERQGYEVQQRSGLVSMELENGESLAVPVDEVELRYIGNRTY